jgi:DNA-binding phage protein
VVVATVFIVIGCPILAEKDSALGEVLTVLRQMALACGGLQAIAAKAGFYRTLSADGNPELKTAIAILRALGLQLQVKRIQPAKKARVVSSGRAARATKSAKLKKAA